MYLEYFGFHRLPFTIAPDPELLFPSRSHQEALAHLHYALTGHGGLVSLTGEVGTGKTTLCRAFLSDLPSHVRSAYVFNPQLSVTELLQSLCAEFGIESDKDASQMELYTLLNNELLKGYAAGQRFICIIDEAQSMPVALLEQVRLLTNLETDREKLLTVILVGQPELRDVLARYDLRQLNQRITARYHLPHLKFTEARDYLSFRCRKAGVEQPLFTRAASRTLWRFSKGIPRLLNSLADRALLGAYATGKKSVTRRLVQGAAGEILVAKPRVIPLQWLFNSAVLALMVVAVWLFYPQLKTHLASLNSTPLTTKTPNTILAKPTSVAAVQDPVALLSRHMQLGGQIDCVALLQSGWHCLWLDWPLSKIRQLQIPTAVAMNFGQGLQWQLLTPFIADYQYAQQALILWQPPAVYQGQLVRPGERDELVSWVRQQLKMDWPNAWQVIAPTGRSANIDAQFYDLLLAQAVESFQRQHGLNADRILGPHTLFMLWQQGR